MIANKKLKVALQLSWTVSLPRLPATSQGPRDCARELLFNSCLYIRCGLLWSSSCSLPSAFMTGSRKYSPSCALNVPIWNRDSHINFYQESLCSESHKAGAVAQRYSACLVCVSLSSSMTVTWNELTGIKQQSPFTKCHQLKYNFPLCGSCFYPLFWMKSKDYIPSQFTSDSRHTRY